MQSLLRLFVGGTAMQSLVRLLMRDLFRCLYRRATALTAVSTAVVFLYSQVAAPLAQASFWTERQKAVKTYQAAHEEHPGARTADALDDIASAASADPAKATQLLASLPGPHTAMLQGLPANMTPSMLPKPSLPPEVSPAVLQRYPLLGELPLAFGSLKDMQLTPGHVQRPLIIHLQDVHLNPEAQLNLASVLQSLLVQGGKGRGQKIGVVGVEAAHGAFNFKLFRAFPDPAITKDIANYLVKQGELGAASYVGITAPEDYSDRFWGVEDPTHYRANVEAIKQSKALQPTYQARLKTLQTTVTQLKAHRFNPTLRAFEAQVNAYREGTLGLGAYVEALVAQGIALGPQTQRFLQTYHREKTLDFDAVEQERKALIEQLVPKLDQATLSQLVAHSVAYRLEQITYATYYRYLQEVCRKYEISLEQYPAMQAYVQYVLQADRINAEALFRELSQAEDAALTKLTQTAEERQLLTIAKQFILIGQLVNLGLTPEQWTAWQAVRTSLTALEHDIQALTRDGVRHRIPAAPSFPSDLNSVPDPKSLTDLTPFERFYLEAEARDEAMVTNLLAQMQTTGASTGVLLAGGFHAAGIARRMRDHRISYVSLAPKITKLDTADGTKYLDVFVREKTPLEKLFAGEKLFIQPADRVLAAVDRSLDGSVVSKTLLDFTYYEIWEAMYEWVKQKLTDTPQLKLKLAAWTLAASLVLGTVGGRPMTVKDITINNHEIRVVLNQTVADGGSFDVAVKGPPSVKPEEDVLSGVEVTPVAGFPVPNLGAFAPSLAGALLGPSFIEFVLMTSMVTFLCAIVYEIGYRVGVRGKEKSTGKSINILFVLAFVEMAIGITLAFLTGFFPPSGFLPGTIRRGNTANSEDERSANVIKGANFDTLRQGAVDGFQVLLDLDAESIRQIEFTTGSDSNVTMKDVVGGEENLLKRKEGLEHIRKAVNAIQNYGGIFMKRISVQFYMPPRDENGLRSMKAYIHYDSTRSPIRVPFSNDKASVVQLLSSIEAAPAQVTQYDLAVINQGMKDSREQIDKLFKVLRRKGLLLVLLGALLMPQALGGMTLRRDTRMIPQAPAVEEVQKVSTAAPGINNVTAIHGVNNVAIAVQPNISGLAQIQGFFSSLPLQAIFQSAAFVGLVAVVVLVGNKLLSSPIAESIGRAITRGTRMIAQYLSQQRPDELPAPPQIPGQAGSPGRGVPFSNFDRVLTPLFAGLVLLVFVASNGAAFALDQSSIPLMYTLGVLGVKPEEIRSAAEVQQQLRSKASDVILDLLRYPTTTMVSVEAGSGKIETDAPTSWQDLKISQYARSLNRDGGSLVLRKVKGETGNSPEVSLEFLGEKITRPFTSAGLQAMLKEVELLNAQVVTRERDNLKDELAWTRNVIKHIKQASDLLIKPFKMVFVTMAAVGLLSQAAVSGKMTFENTQVVAVATQGEVTTAAPKESVREVAAEVVNLLLTQAEQLGVGESLSATLRKHQRPIAETIKGVARKENFPAVVGLGVVELVSHQVPAQLDELLSVNDQGKRQPDKAAGVMFSTLGKLSLFVPTPVLKEILGAWVRKLPPKQRMALLAHFQREPQATVEAINLFKEGKKAMQTEGMTALKQGVRDVIRQAPAATQMPLGTMGEVPAWLFIQKASQLPMDKWAEFGIYFPKAIKEVEDGVNSGPWLLFGYNPDTGESWANVDESVNQRLTEVAKAKGFPQRAIGALKQRVQLVEIHGTDVPRIAQSLAQSLVHEQIQVENATVTVDWLTDENNPEVYANLSPYGSAYEYKAPRITLKIRFSSLIEGKLIEAWRLFAISA